MKSAVFIACAGIVLFATVAGAGELRQCTGAEIAEWRAFIAELQRHPEQIPFRGPGISYGPGITCDIAAQGGLGTGLGGRPRPPRGGRGSIPQQGINRSNEPCWIIYPQRGDPDFGWPLREGMHYGYCPDRVPRVPRPTRRPAVTPLPIRRPAPIPSPTLRNGDADYWRGKLLESLPTSRDIDGVPVWRPRQPPVNLLELPTAPARKGGGCPTNHPNAAC